MKVRTEQADAEESPSQAAYLLNVVRFTYLGVRFYLLGWHNHR